MHVLIGFTIIVGLIAIGFGGGTARAFVRGIIYCAAAVVLAACYMVAVEMYRTTPEAVRSERATAAYRTTPRTCEEWTNWRPTTVDNCKKWSDGSPTTVQTSAPLSSYATSCWKWSARDKTMVPVGCDDADALTGPPGGEPRCGAACAETTHSDTNIRRAAK
jgi:hypothetical protein